MTPVAAVLATLREVLDLLSNPESECVITPEPCRVLLAPGATVAWDTCGDYTCQDKDGQLWANLDPMNVINPGNCDRVIWQATIGIVRCAAVVNDDGSPPLPAQIEADADQQALDADAIWHAIRCCETRSDSIRDLELVSWLPLGPQGGCVGGAWTIRGVLDVCC